jgi:hypothetical protein
MRTIVVGGAAAFAAVCALSITAPAIAAPPAANPALRAAATGDMIKVRNVYRKHPRRAYVDVPVAPRAAVAAPGCPGLYSWNPANPDRGYCDPGFAYHGNINGCAEDLGYGRWVSCDNFR